MSQMLFANQDRDGVVHQVFYKELVARYVRIHPTTFQGKACMRGELYGVKTITENIALGKPTNQSSTAWDGVQSRAVDGNRNSAWVGGSCTHTDNEAAPWWQVDLETTKSIAEVLIVARGDSSVHRLWSNTFELLIGAFH
ncbi:fucolectin-6-like [Nematostella vectensis]|uniref:fucolectin-6-like n=1 Tax=Nematostella vectensis TaxID=45351 RepID=UPI002076EC6C|nr:fucolectin-6-like [Nematostella vectensis]